MARKTKEIVIETDGRDKGKRFLATEMVAYDWMRWTARATLAVSRSGGNVPAGILQQGMMGVIGFGLQAITTLEWADAEPLMAEIFAGVKFKPDPKKDWLALNLRGEDIEESSTFIKLFEEVCSLNLGFSLAEAGPKFLTALATLILPKNSSIASTSLPLSEGLSPNTVN